MSLLEYPQQLTMQPLPAAGTNALAPTQEASPEGSALAIHVPEGDHWRDIKKWVVFSDLHVSAKTAEVRILYYSAFGNTRCDSGTAA